MFTLRCFLCWLTQTVVLQAALTKGPPTSNLGKQQGDTKVVGRLGQTLKLSCPIQAKPEPMIEWGKDGEKIDFTWTRHKSSRKSLKIKSVEAMDSGVYTCKGINGFGSLSVRFQVIIIDPSQYPDWAGTSDNGLLSDLAPPVFSSFTLKQSRNYKLKVGDNFEVECDALGSPEPIVKWFKNGEPLRKSGLLLLDHAAKDNKVKAEDKSKLSLPITSVSDAGDYSCKAANLVGETHSLQFSLEVQQQKYANNKNNLQKHGVPGFMGTSRPTDLVTEAGPQNSTVRAGLEADLWCKVRTTKSLAIAPFVQWMKRVDPDDETQDGEGGGGYVINVGSERFKVIQEKGRRGEDKGSQPPRITVATNYSDEKSVFNSAGNVFSSHLKIEESRPSDQGMYVCFVTDDGQLSYKSVSLKITTTEPSSDGKAVSPAVLSFMPTQGKLLSWLVTSSIVAGIGLLSSCIMLVALCMVCWTTGEDDLAQTDGSDGKGRKVSSSIPPDLLREPCNLTVTSSVYPTPTASSLPSWTSNLTTSSSLRDSRRLLENSCTYETPNVSSVFDGGGSGSKDDSGFLSTFKSAAAGATGNLYEVPYYSATKRSYSLDNTLTSLGGIGDDYDNLPAPPSTLGSSRGGGGRASDDASKKLVYSKSCFTIEDGYHEPVFVSAPFNV